MAFRPLDILRSLFASAPQLSQEEAEALLRHPEGEVGVDCTRCGGWAAFTGDTTTDDAGRTFGIYLCPVCGETFPAWSRRNEEAVMRAAREKEEGARGGSDAGGASGAAETRPADPERDAG